MDSEDVGKWLPFENQGRHKIIELLQFLCGHVDPFTGNGQFLLILTLCILCKVEIVPKRTLSFRPTAVADIRVMISTVTLKRHEQRAELLWVFGPAPAAGLFAFGRPGAIPGVRIAAPDGTITVKRTEVTAFRTIYTMAKRSVSPDFF